MDNRVVKELMENGVRFVKSGVKLIEKKIDEKNRQWQKEQNEIQKQKNIYWANRLKAEMKSYFEEILREDIHFSTESKVSFSECYFDVNDNCWKIKLRTMINNQFDMQRPLVLTSLNETKETYLMKLGLEREQELSEVELMKQNPNVNPVNIELTYRQINMKYQILNCNFAFCRIEDEEKKEYKTDYDRYGV